MDLGRNTTVALRSTNKDSEFPENCGIRMFYDKKHTNLKSTKKGTTSGPVRSRAPTTTRSTCRSQTQQITVQCFSHWDYFHKIWRSNMAGVAASATDTRQGISAFSSYALGIAMLILPFTGSSSYLLTFLVPSLVLCICRWVAHRIYLRR